MICQGCGLEFASEERVLCYLCEPEELPDEDLEPDYGEPVG